MGNYCRSRPRFQVLSRRGAAPRARPGAAARPPGWRKYRECECTAPRSSSPWEGRAGSRGAGTRGRQIPAPPPAQPGTGWGREEEREEEEEAGSGAGGRWGSRSGRTREEARFGLVIPQLLVFPGWIFHLCCKAQPQLRGQACCSAGVPWAGQQPGPGCRGCARRVLAAAPPNLEGGKRTVWGRGRRGTKWEHEPHGGGEASVNTRREVP